MTDPVDGTFLSFRAYARHRAGLELSGTSHNAVGKAVKSGRLVESVHETPKGLRIDPEVADREWRENTAGTLVREPAGGRAPDSLFEGDELPDAQQSERAKSSATLANANTLQAVYRARLLRLDFELKEGRLVDRESVDAEAFRLYRLVRENLLKIPTRISSQLAAITDSREIRALIETEIVTALASLGD